MPWPLRVRRRWSGDRGVRVERGGYLGVDSGVVGEWAVGRYPPGEPGARRGDGGEGQRGGCTGQSSGGPLRTGAARARGSGAEFGDQPAIRVEGGLRGVVVGEKAEPVEQTGLCGVGVP